MFNCIIKHKNISVDKPKHKKLVNKKVCKVLYLTILSRPNLNGFYKKKSHNNRSRKINR